ncbi:hypothetical protein [Alicyclobacillus sp. SO9]|uniref:hypothetical protein n=1 Tax=Alicyclobacillus sp. SO9 TaxID=2665646 RepID=UPI0018E8A61C|nr:hypothetical protein [Alicyclobacillus sp. SO9]QQE79159.1 hypothetical protein GI364_01170 [Alicyclobacillus sp. SO9]
MSEGRRRDGLFNESGDLVLNRWVKYLLWIIGMFILLRLGDYAILKARIHADATTHIGSMVWTLAIVPVIYGVYVSLLFAKRRPGVNLPLFLLVFLPCILFNVYVPVSTQMHLMLYPWMTQALSVTGVVAGLTLILSFFG